MIGQVLKEIRNMGIRNLRFAPSAVVNLKNPSISEFVEDGTITKIEASGIRGDLGDAVLEGKMENPVILRPHGARPRAIENYPLMWRLSVLQRRTITEIARGRLEKMPAVPLDMHLLMLTMQDAW